MACDDGDGDGDDDGDGDGDGYGDYNDRGDRHEYTTNDGDNSGS
jgi:hypothetical protein